MDQSRVLFLAAGKPELVLDLKANSPPTPLSQFVGDQCVGGENNTLFHWNGGDQILIHEVRGTEYLPRGAITLNSSERPTAFTYNAKRRLVAWTAGISSKSIYLASLDSPERRVEFTSDISGVN